MHTYLQILNGYSALDGYINIEYVYIIYIYIYVHMCIYIYICINTYMHSTLKIIFTSMFANIAHHHCMTLSVVLVGHGFAPDPLK